MKLITLDFDYALLIENTMFYDKYDIMDIGEYKNYEICLKPRFVIFIESYS